MSLADFTIIILIALSTVTWVPTGKPILVGDCAAALGETASKMRIVQAEIVTQRIEQRHVVVRLYGAHLSIDVEGILLGHGASVLHMRSDIFIGAGHVPV